MSKAKANLYYEDEPRNGHKLTSREKSMAKDRDLKDHKAGKLRRQSSTRKTFMEDD